MRYKNPPDYAEADTDYDDVDVVENPASVVRTARDERLWSMAKKSAADQGRARDWPYIMGIFQHMKHRSGSEPVGNPDDCACYENPCVCNPGERKGSATSDAILKAFPQVVDEIQRGSRADVLERIGDYSGLPRAQVARAMTRDPALVAALQDLAKTAGFNLDYFASQPPGSGNTNTRAKSGPSRARAYLSTRSNPEGKAKWQKYGPKGVDWEGEWLVTLPDGRQFRTWRDSEAESFSFVPASDTTTYLPGRPGGPAGGTWGGFTREEAERAMAKTAVVKNPAHFVKVSPGAYSALEVYVFDPAHIEGGAYDDEGSVETSRDILSSVVPGGLAAPSEDEPQRCWAWHARLSYAAESAAESGDYPAAKALNNLASKCIDPLR
jgi:hypothetical protein